MNWGKGIALALFIFAGMMAFFVVKAIQNPTPLVTENYYEQELKFQGRIDNVQRANALSAQVELELSNTGIRMVFPAEMQRRSISGELTLMRPNDPDADRTVVIDLNGPIHFFAPLEGLVPGRYNAMIEWQVEGTNYYTEEKLVLQ